MPDPVADGAPDDEVVPKQLLAEVLDEAQGNLWTKHGKSCIGTDLDADGRHSCDKAQEKIDALRRQAGIEA